MTDSAATPLLEARHLMVVLPGDEGDHDVLDRADLALFAGDVVDVVGESGAGKSTLLRALARMMPPAYGTLLLKGVLAQDIPASEWRCHVALVPQKPVLVPGTVADNLRLPWTLLARKEQTPPSEAALRGAIDAVGLPAVALDRDVSRVSVGQLARIALVRTMLTDPEVLLLDEADAALDDASAGLVGAVVAEYARAGHAVARVRHRGPDGRENRRIRIAGGKLEEVERS